MSRTNPVPAEIPEWLLEPETVGGVQGKKPRSRFLVNTLHHLSEVFENDFFCERYAKKPLLLQLIDPRIKLLAILGFLLVSAFCSNPVVLLVLAGVALLYAKLSGLAMGDFLRRAWGYLPVVIFLFSLPGVSSLFLSGKPLFYLIPPGALGLREGLSFSSAGIEVALRLAMRAGISLSFGFLLLLTTRWSAITGALSSLRVPRLFLAVLNMAYRYLFIMAEQAGGMMEARYLRTVGRLGSAENRRFMGRSMAVLFVKSHQLSGEIYDAMVCRGYSGKPMQLDTFRIRPADLLFAVNNALILILLIGGNVFFESGRF